jgi:phosphate-selective porin OprO and OprP
VLKGRAALSAAVMCGLLSATGMARAQGLVFPPPPAPVSEFQPAPPADDVRFVWREHPSLRFGRAVRLDFTLRLQEDARDPGDSPADFSTWELHRFRVGLDGELFQRIQFSVEREARENENDSQENLVGSQASLWKDVYVDANLSTGFQIRAGRFKIPFGVEELTSIASLDFVYRSVGTSYLAPARDTGLELHGRFFGRGLQYYIGGFQHDGDNAKSRKIKGGDETWAGRITGTPFKRTKKAHLDNLEFGTAMTSTSVSDESVLPNGLRGRTVMSQFTFYEPVFVKGTRTRLEADVDWNAGRFNARGEYMWVSDQRKNQGFGDEDLPDARATAWFVSGTFLLTGDRKDRPLEPRRPLFRGGAGAIEIAGRYERLEFGGVPGDDEPFRNPRAITIMPVSDTVASIGINWYLNRWVRIQANTIRELIDDDERSPVLNGAAFWSQIVRFQLAL